MPAWKKAKNPLYSVSKSLNTMIETETPYVLIDLRDKASAEKAHIKGAISIPAAELATAKDRFPSIKSAPVIIYGADTEAGMASFATIRGWGFKNATVLKGGFGGWDKASLPVDSGATATEIVYVPKPKAGSVSVEMFAKAADSATQEVIILDVRTDEETEEGTLARALAIPAEEVIERLDEIPKDKPVYIHCSTGIRAEMAYITLKENGYNAKFLDATITVADGGKYEITNE